MKKTWILVADSANARIFEADAIHGPLKEIRDLANSEAHLMNRDLDSDGPGKGSGGGGEHHAMDTTSNSKDHEIEGFARYVVHELDAARKQNLFEQVIFVAAPSFLGLMREMVSGPLSDMVVYELDKNLGKLDSEEVGKRIIEILPNYAM